MFGWGLEAPVTTASPLFYADATLSPGAELPLPAEHEERGAYVVQGTVEVAGVRFEAGRMLLFRARDQLALRAGAEGARLLLLGGAAMDGPRFIFWNFVSSSRERIEQAQADWKHFGKGLIDRGVEILDPSAGTGTFICELLEHFRGQPKKLEWKYANELHANEVAILSYYVANLNIEATYAALTKTYAEFPALCFVDTLDNVSGLGIRPGQQLDLLAGLSDENVERVKRQNRAKISVVIGNPPYNANQQNENDNNENRTYPHIDDLIKQSYVKQSSAQLNVNQYDMYTRFFRWASDRLGEDGVIAFITNNSFAKKPNYDGFRKIAAEQFCDIYVIDFKGDARTSGEPRRREGDNIFENAIKVGIAISFMVRKASSKKPCSIHYAAVPDYAKLEEKQAFIFGKRLGDISFEHVKPDAKHNWVGISEND